MPRPRRPINDRPYYPIYYNDRHLLICRLTVRGLTPSQIASQVGVNPQVVIYTVNSPLMQRYIGKLRSKAAEKSTEIPETATMKRLEALEKPAVDIIQDILDKGQVNDTPASPALVFRAAESVLDRRGFGKIIRGQFVHGHFSADDIEGIKRQAKVRRDEVADDAITVESTLLPEGSTPESLVEEKAV